MTYRGRCAARALRRRMRYAKRWLRAHRATVRRLVKKPDRPRVTTNFWEEYQKLGHFSGEGWWCTLGGACPVQGEGEVDGVPFYFRARGEGWRIEFGLGSDAEGELQGETIFERSGMTVGEYSASWIRARHARALVRACVNDFRVWRRKPGSRG